MAVAKKVIRKEIQVAVNEYVQLHMQAKTIERRMKELKKEIEPYMAEAMLDLIAHSDGIGAIVIQPQNRPTMNARYTTYEIDDLIGVADPKVLAETIVERVDAETVKFLLAQDKLPKQVEQLKRLTTTHAFMVR